MKTIFFIISLIISLFVEAQFAPSVGQTGSTAISMHSNQFVGWATGCTIERGWLDIADTSLGKVAHGIPDDALGSPNPNVVSLGDGGSATLTFEIPISNNEGFDFAVFENSFDDYFLELAFVEVSTNGVDYVRFPCVSKTDTINQLGSFGLLDATKLYNLAGKYKGRFGTPFDLDELKDSISIDINEINYVRIIDVVGSINPKYTSYDSKGNKINDPYPTSFITGGFDLDAVGIIDESIQPNLSLSEGVENKIIIKNLIRKGENIELLKPCVMYNSVGSRVCVFNEKSINTSILEKGVYFLRTETINHKIVIY